MAEGGNPAAAAAHFIYDVNGIRVQHWNEALSPAPAAATLATSYLVDSQNHTGYAQILQERTPGAGGELEVARSYVIGDDVLSQVVGGGGEGDLQHPLYDGHGSTRLLYDAESGGSAGVLAQVYDYDAYGNALGFDAADPAATLTNLLYCGEQFDQTQQVGMLYLRARWYDAGVGSFTRTDPASATSHPESLGCYQYANADPISSLDPTGKFATYITNLATMMAWGALLSISFNGLVNFSQNRPFFENALGAALFGAVALPLAVAFPLFGIALAAYSSLITYENRVDVWANPGSSNLQRGAAVLAFAGSLYGVRVAGRYAGREGLWYRPGGAHSPPSAPPIVYREATLGELFPELPDDTMIHRTPAPEEAFQNGV